MNIDCGGISIYYQKSGFGPPLLLLHGNGESGGIFSGSVPILARDFTVYTPDTRGHGGSGAGVLDYALMAEDLRLFITGLGLKKPMIVGFSDGGITALLLASRYPDLPGGVIACGANLSPGGIKRRFRGFYRLVYFFGRSPLYALMLTQPQINGEILSKITAPALITAGSRDIIKTSHTKKIAGLVPGARLKILRGQTHSSYIINGESFAALIKDFAVPGRSG